MHSDDFVSGGENRVKKKIERTFAFFVPAEHGPVLREESASRLPRIDDAGHPV